MDMHVEPDKPARRAMPGSLVMGVFHGNGPTSPPTNVTLRYERDTFPGVFLVLLSEAETIQFRDLLQQERSGYTDTLLVKWLPSSAGTHERRAMLAFHAGFSGTLAINLSVQLVFELAAQCELALHAFQVTQVHPQEQES